MSKKLSPKKDEMWQIAFLEQLRKIPNVTHAADVAGVSRQITYHERAKDETFAAAWDAALDEAVERLELEMHRRAYQGTDHPVIHRGEITNTYKTYSDTLAIFLAKAHRPEKYRERSEILQDTTLNINVTYGDDDVNN